MHLNHNDTLVEKWPFLPLFSFNPRNTFGDLKKTKYPGVGNPSPRRGPKNDIQYHSRHGILKYGTKEQEAKNKVPSF